MSRNIKRWTECEIHLSADELADVFWHMDAEEQAHFFERLNEVSDGNLAIHMQIRSPPMTTNKPGTVTQQPLYGCTSCYEDCTYTATDLRVYDNECWCEECWDIASYEVSGGIDWTDLAPFKPALQAECERLAEALEEALHHVVISPDPVRGDFIREIEAALDAYRKGEEP